MICKLEVFRILKSSQAKLPFDRVGAVPLSKQLLISMKKCQNPIGCHE